MRKITEKIAIVAQVCITLIFVVTSILYIMGIIPYNEGLRDNGVFVTLLVILAIVYGLLSVYIIYVNFSESEYLRQILLFCDSESATHANVKVIRNIVRSCAKKVHGIRVRRVKMRIDEKQGFVITLKVNVSGDEVSTSIDKLRCLIADSFKNTLNLNFNSINFEIRRLKSHYKPNVERAEKLAKTLSEQREVSNSVYENPFEDSCETCNTTPSGTSPVEQVEADDEESTTKKSNADMPESDESSDTDE